MKMKLMAVAASVLALVACADPHKGMHCTQSHDESYIWYSQQCFSYNSQGICTMSIPIPHEDTRTICDNWVPDETKSPEPR